MASSIQVPCKPSSLNRVCWTFIFRGGRAFTLLVPEGYIGSGHDHDGRGMSIWKFMGTTDEADVVEQMLEDSIEGLRIEKTTEIENDEMKAIRQERLGLTGVN